MTRKEQILEKERKKLEDVGLSFFNDAFENEYDYCILYEDLLFGLYKLLEFKIDNKYNNPIYTNCRVSILPEKFNNKNVLLLVQSIEDRSKWFEVKRYIEFLKEKKNAKLDVRIMILEETLVSWFQKECESFNKIKLHDVKSETFSSILIKYYKTAKEEYGDYKLDNEKLIKKLEDSTYHSMVWFLLYSIFDTDFIKDEEETVIFNDLELYFLYFHLLNKGEIKNLNKKKVVAITTIEQKEVRKIIEKTEVVTIIVKDKQEDAKKVEKIKIKLKNINPKIGEMDIYVEDLLHMF